MTLNPLHGCYIHILHSLDTLYTEQQEINSGGAYGIFALDTSTGTIIRGTRDVSAAQSTTILSVLIVILLLAIGGLMAVAAHPPNPGKDQSGV